MVTRFQVLSMKKRLLISLAPVETWLVFHKPNLFCLETYVAGYSFKKEIKDIIRFALVFEELANRIMDIEW